MVEAIAGRLSALLLAAAVLDLESLPTAPDLLVELRGFEPLTPSMRTRCATGLRHSPEYGSPEGPSARLPARSGGAALHDLTGVRIGVEAGQVDGVHVVQREVVVVDADDALGLLVE